MLGVLDDVSRATRCHFTTPGDGVVLLGEPTDEIGGSEYLSAIHGVTAGAPPACDLDRERALIEAILACIATGEVRSAHDVSDGGLAVALAECAVGDLDHPTGLEANLGAWTTLPMRALLFGEGQARVVVSSPNPQLVIDVAAKHGVPARQIGTVREASGGFAIDGIDRPLRADTAALASAYHDAIPTRMRAPAGAGAAA
jgi:phosphoribosylformylglycinamidine synthase